MTDNPASLKQEIDALEWYHTLDLAPGMETPGWQDTRRVAADVPFPRLDGLRCLDVGTFDGFWAFEMERRGAREVVAIDILDPRQWDWPVGSDEKVIETIGRRKAGGRGFEIAKRELGSSVERLELSVYDLEPGEVGPFDVVFVGSLLLHLRDPVRALERVRGVCGGTLVLMDGIDLLLSLILPARPVATFDGTGRPWWWYPNAAGLARMVRAAGFEVRESPRRVFIPPGKGRPLPSPRPQMLTNRAGREAVIAKQFGDPHAVLTASPRAGASA